MEKLGPGMWLSLHGLAEEFHNDSKMYKRLVISIFRKIPCNQCSRDAFNYLTRNDITNPMEWICKFHNHVNEKIGKPAIRCQKYPVAHVRARAGQV